MKIRWLKVLRELWQNPVRTLLVVISIAVGVFAVGTIATAWAILIDDLNTAYNATNPASAVLVTTPIDEDVVRAVEGRRDIATAEGRRSTIVKLTDGDGRQVNLNVYAVEDFQSLQLNQMTPEEGSWPPLRRELLLERSWLGELGLSIGEEVTVETADGRDYRLTLAGTAHDLHVVAAGNTEVATGYATLDTLGYLGEPQTYNTLYLTVSQNPLDENHISQVVSEVKDQTLEPAGHTVISTTIPTPGEAFLTVIIQAVVFTLGVVGIFALLLSAALVINTISAVIARQTKQIGVMKAIGGEQAQILEIYLGSVVIYALLSLAIGIPAAALGGRAFVGFFAEIGNFDVLTTGIPPLVILLEVAVGLIVPVVAGLIPIMGGLNITVREAISDYGLGDEDETLLDRIASKLRGLPSTVALSLRNTFRRQARLALTLGTLTLAGAVFISVLSVRQSLFQDFEAALVYYGFDLSINMGDSYRTERLERELARVEGIANSETWLEQQASLIRPDGSESTNYPIVGLPAQTDFIEPQLLEGRWLAETDTNGVVINSDLVREEGVGLGDTLTLIINGEESEWQVMGIATKQYSTPIIYVGIDNLGRATEQVGRSNRVLLSLIDQRTEDATALAAEEQLKRVGLEVGTTTTRSSFIETFSFRFNFLVIFLVALAALLAFVGGLGLAGTMSLNVLDRIREIGVMRAIGASDGSILKIILAEGLVIGVFSWLFGAVAAAPLAYGLATGIGFAFAGEPLSFSFSALGVSLWLVLALVIAAVSSFVPARRASRLSIRETLAYE
jgi:putative ABC transport system permease protein